ncbi:AAA family ATPase [Desulfopila inferna]|uniref:AAA family ATPase n=1 Tax=Desulfopila inferna TaxID=468528 RepID=UPI001965FC75|nr:AAA family ATPase [Desulfopila inferna]MBM9605942.1 ATP-binding protein [Desulfopila inferna]
MKEIRVLPKFVNVKNVRNFQAMIDALMLSAGEGRLAAVIGPAGRGKTRTAQWYAANKRCAFVRCLSIWRHTELGFLQALCRELGVKKIPHRKDPAFLAVMDALNTQGGRPVFVEEIEKLPRLHLELVRDLSDLSAAPFVLIGEDELQHHMRQVTRIWNRTFQQLEFEPLGLGDVVMFARDAAGIDLPADVAETLHREAGGCFRVIKRDLISLVNIMNAKARPVPDMEMVKAAIKQSLRG